MNWTAVLCGAAATLLLGYLIIQVFIWGKSDKQ